MPALSENRQTEQTPLLRKTTGQPHLDQSPPLSVARMDQEMRRGPAPARSLGEECFGKRCRLTQQPRRRHDVLPNHVAHRKGSWHLGVQISSGA